MARPIPITIALTVGGSDSGGGAGIQADLKTFAALGVHGASVLTCVTAQSPARILGIEPVSAKMVGQQLEAVFSEMRPGAVKVGMFYSEKILRVLVEFLDAHGADVPLIVDPVMIATSGARLLQPGAMEWLQNELLPRATLVTPNVPEAEILSGHKIRSVEDLRTAARRIRGRYGCAAVVKGGHLPAAREAIDIYFDGVVEKEFRGRLIKNLRTHGTGCTYSAAIAAFVCRGATLLEAVGRGKKYIAGAIAGGHKVGRRVWLKHFK